VIYDTQIDEFLDAVFEAGRNGDPFDDTVERLADDHGVHRSDGTYQQARRKWGHGQVHRLAWCSVTGGESTAAAVTSGGTKVLLTVRSHAPHVIMEEVTPEGVPFRRMGAYPNVNEAFDTWGLRAP
jgi:hypothetical protein